MEPSGSVSLPALTPYMLGRGSQNRQKYIKNTQNTQKYVKRCIFSVWISKQNSSSFLAKTVALLYTLILGIIAFQHNSL